MILRLTQTRVFLVRSMAGLSWIIAKLRRSAIFPSRSPIPSPPPYPRLPYIEPTFHLLPPQDASEDEIWYHREINCLVRVKLGCGKAFAVLFKEFEGLDVYVTAIRPYRLEQPNDLLDLTMLIPSSEARLFADSIRTLISFIGLERSYQVLQGAKIEVPGVRYEVQRVRIPPAAVCPETSTTSNLAG